MSWPDDGGLRFVVDAQPTVRVLDRAYCHRVVEEWLGPSGSSSRRGQLNLADALAHALNRQDDLEAEEAA